MIRCILFDQARVQTYDVFSRKKSYSINGKEFSAKVLDAIFYSEKYKEFDIGKIKEEDFILNFIKKENLNLSIEEFKELLKKGIEPVEGIKEIIKELSKRFHLATLINEGTEWANYKLDTPGFRQFFQEIIISGELGIKKPNKEFFLKSLEIINAEPKECIFIDDKEENCLAAEQLGIKSIIFKDSEQLKEELIKLQVL